MRVKFVLPARAYGKRLVYEFRNYAQGPSFKVFLREKLKGVPEYHTPIELDNPAIAGRTDTGVPIPINTLGKWLFGVPGYAGNAVFDGFSDPPKVVVNISEVQPEVIELIDRLFSAAGGLRQE